MNMRALVWLTAFLTTVSASAADAWQTLDLRAFTNFTALEKAEADVLVPRGRQVFDGAPFLVEGFAQLGKRSAGAGKPEQPAPASINLPVSRVFGQLHLLTALEGNTSESNVVTRVVLNYEGGSNATLELTFGDQVRRWDAALHKTERSLRDTNHATVAWIGQSARLASSDRYGRLYHVALNNPQPGSTVKSLTLASVQTNCWPIIAGVTVASADAPRLTNTVNLPTNPFPDMRKRNGAPAVLTGVVRTREGSPVTNALVRIVAERGMNTQDYQASSLGARASTSTQTDATGRFELPAQPDNKLYHVLVAAQGLGSFVYPGADPKSEPLEIRLQPSARTNVFQVRVKLVDEDGTPFGGALIEPEGVRYGGGTSWGGNQGFPSYTASDANGEFQLGRDEMFTSLQMSVTAPNFAPLKVWVDVSNALQTFVLNAGATVRGRVLRDGQPLTNVTIGVSGVDRSSEVYVGHFTTDTDANGVFTFGHLPTRTSFWLFGKMDSLKAHGAIRPQQILTAATGQKPATAIRCPKTCA
jgi:uncharacterized GH25 family protein